MTNPDPSPDAPPKHLVQEWTGTRPRTKTRQKLTRYNSIYEDYDRISAAADTARSRDRLSIRTPNNQSDHISHPQPTEETPPQRASVEAHSEHTSPSSPSNPPSVHLGQGQLRIPPNETDPGQDGQRSPKQAASISACSGAGTGGQVRARERQRRASSPSPSSERPSPTPGQPVPP